MDGLKIIVINITKFTLKSKYDLVWDMSQLHDASKSTAFDLGLLYNWVLRGLDRSTGLKNNLKGISKGLNASSLELDTTLMSVESLFDYNQQFKVLRCKRCKVFLTRSSFRYHLKVSHGLDSQAIKHIATEIRDWDLVRLSNEVILPPQFSQPVPGIMVRDGVKCGFCPYICIMETSMADHMNRQHQHEYQGISHMHATKAYCSPVRCQQLFSKGINSHMIEVVNQTQLQGRGTQLQGPFEYVPDFRLARCTDCRVFVSRSGLYGHLMHAHDLNDAHMANMIVAGCRGWDLLPVITDETFSGLQPLRAPLEGISAIQGFKCGFCSFLALNLQDIAGHINRHHRFEVIGMTCEQAAAKRSNIVTLQSLTDQAVEASRLVEIFSHSPMSETERPTPVAHTLGSNQRLSPKELAQRLSALENANKALCVENENLRHKLTPVSGEWKEYVFRY